MRFEIAGTDFRGVGRWHGRRLMVGASVAAIFVAAAATSAHADWFFSDPGVRQATMPAPAVAVKRPHTANPVKRKRALETRNGKAKEIEKLPPGPLLVVISIRQQRLTLYANGQPVAHSQVSTGVPGHPTPMGVFSVIEKNRYHHSNIYSGAPMPFMQRITWSGVAMHEGVVPGHPASHGCIRLPGAFAQRLWGITKLGARVIIAQDEVTPREISSPRLFASSPLVSEAPAEAPAAKIRLATAAGIPDMSLKGSIDGNDESRIEKAIDQAVQNGLAEAESYLADQPEPARALDKGPVLATPKDPMLKPGPISVYISRKNARLYVRKGFAEVFDAPVTIRQPDQPLGTHVFTALKADDANAWRWNVVSLPTERTVKKGKYISTMTARGEKLRKELAAPQHEITPPGSPNEALDRVSIPDDALTRITELMTPGASLIISDLGLSYETGKGTDFIVLTR